MRPSQLPPSGAARLASTRYFTTNANPNNAPRLLISRFESKSAKRLFQSVQKKQKPTTQKSIPCSGMSELNTCADAAKSVNRSQPFAALRKSEYEFENHLPSLTIPALAKSAISITAKIRQSSGGGRNTNEESVEARRKPPSRVTVRSTEGRSKFIDIALRLEA